jgi:hypothetical protein
MSPSYLPTCRLGSARNSSFLEALNRDYRCLYTGVHGLDAALHKGLILLIVVTIIGKLGKLCNEFHGAVKIVHLPCAPGEPTVSGTFSGNATLPSGMRKEANREIGGPRDDVYRLAGFQQNWRGFLWLAPSRSRLRACSLDTRGEEKAKPGSVPQGR